MPINLKELFIYDTNQIRIEKINYNFDQMLGVGGQLGPKGLKGDFGPIGPEGEKGQKGEIGPTGVAGENGADGFTYWLSVPSTTLDANILKPIFNTNNQNSVYLGDSTQSASSSGNTSADSVLVIDRPQIYDNHLELKGLYNSLTIKGEFFNSGGTVLDVFSIKKGFGISGSNPVKLDVAFDDVSINTTGNGLLGILSISSSNSVELSAVSGFNVSQGTISTFNDRVFVTGDLIVTGTGFTKVSSGTTSQRNDIATNELEGGVIRYNTSTNKLEAYFEGTSSGSIWLPLRELTDADKDTRVDISLTNDNDTIDLVTKDDVAMRLGGTTQDIGNGDFRKPIITNYDVFSQQNIHFANENKGISFPDGGEGGFLSGAAPNSGSSLAQRTLHDYFQRPNTFFDLGDSQFLPGTDAGYTGGAVPGTSVTLPTFEQRFGFSKENCVITNTVFGARTGTSFDKLSTAIDVNKTRMTYTKIGNLVTVNFDIYFSIFSPQANVSTNDEQWNSLPTGTLQLMLPGITDVYNPVQDVTFSIFVENLMDIPDVPNLSSAGYYCKWRKVNNYMGVEAISGDRSILNNRPAYLPYARTFVCPQYDDTFDTSNYPSKITGQFSFITGNESYENTSLTQAGVDPTDLGGSTGAGPG